MKVAMVYMSVHHKNTEKVAKAMADAVGADLFDLTTTKEIDLSSYDMVGFASGIYAGNMHKIMLKFIDSAKLPKKAFLVCTCGVPIIDYTKKVKSMLFDKGIEVIDSFESKAFNTFGPFALIGGTGKGRPNEKDLEKAKEFIKRIIAC